MESLHVTNLMSQLLHPHRTENVQSFDTFLYKNWRDVLLRYFHRSPFQIYSFKTGTIHRILSAVGNLWLALDLLWTSNLPYLAQEYTQMVCHSEVEAQNQLCVFVLSPIQAWIYLFGHLFMCVSRCAPIPASIRIPKLFMAKLVWLTENEGHFHSCSMSCL